MTALDPKVARRRAIRAQVVGDHSIGNEAVFLQELAHQFQRGVLVPFGLDQHVEDLTFRIDSAPEIDHAAGDFQIRLIQMPGAVWVRAALAQIGCDHGTEMIYPAPNGLVRDQNPALRQQVFHIAKAEREPKIQPYRLAYNLRREAVAGVADFLHSIRYRAARPIASPKRRDNARAEHLRGPSQSGSSQLRLREKNEIVGRRS